MKNSIETPIFWQKKIVFFFDLLGSPGVVPLLQASLDIKNEFYEKVYDFVLHFFFTMTISIFYERKAGNPGIEDCAAFDISDGKWMDYGCANLIVGQVICESNLVRY